MKPFHVLVIHLGFYLLLAAAVWWTDSPLPLLALMARPECRAAAEKPGQWSEKSG